MPCLNGEIAPTIFANPHCVRLSVPELGFGDDLDATVQFCLERGQELRTGCFRRRADHRDWIFYASAIRRMRTTSQSVLAEKFLYLRLMIFLPVSKAQVLISSHENRCVGQKLAAASSGHSLTYRRTARFLYHVAFTISVAIIGNGSLPSLTEAEEQMRLGLPVNCKLGLDCFVQQMPDVDPGPGTMDSLCGKATYQGHDGWDIRLRSLSDIAQDVPVTAVADGTVSRIRDGVPDQIFDAANDRLRLRDRECGNGMVIDHQGGLSSQYCHLKNGSLSVRSGMEVRKGERIGSIGSSGAAEFPHVHLSVRLDGKMVEPLTGKTLGNEAFVCGDLSGSLLDTCVQGSIGPTRCCHPRCWHGCCSTRTVQSCPSGWTASRDEPEQFDGRVAVGNQRR